MKSIIFYWIVGSIILLGCNREGKNLPKSISEEEVKNYLPKSINYETSPYELLMQNHGLVDVQSLDEEIKVNLRYSTENNFLFKDIYGNLELAFLQPEVAKALSQANQLLISKNSHYRLLVYDAARPFLIQKELWSALDSLPVNERKKYVASPEQVSIHNYGCAVDLTIIDKVKNLPLDMGTDFDHFGELAYPKLERKLLNEGKLSPDQIHNRLLLREIMQDVGFTPINTEWWHFNYYSRENAALKFKVIE